MGGCLMVVGNSATAERQDSEAAPQPNAALAIGGIAVQTLRVTGYSILRILTVSNVPGSIEIFERVQEEDGQPVGIFTRTLGPLASFASVDPDGAVTEQICFRHPPCGDIILVRYTNGGVVQAFFNFRIEGLPIA